MPQQDDEYAGFEFLNQTCGSCACYHETPGMFANICRNNRFAATANNQIAYYTHVAANDLACRAWELHPALEKRDEQA